jgi:hypothetical protein
MLFKWPLFQYQFLLLCLLILLRDNSAQAYWINAKFIDNMLMGVLFFWVTFTFFKRIKLSERLVFCIVLAVSFALVYQPNHLLSGFWLFMSVDLVNYFLISFTVFLGSLLAYLLLLWSINKAMMG